MREQNKAKIAAVVTKIVTLSPARSVTTDGEEGEQMAIDNRVRFMADLGTERSGSTFGWQ